MAWELTPQPYSRSGLAPLSGSTFSSTPVVAGILGILLGLPTIRLAGHYLGIASLTFGIIIEQIFLNWISLTRGPMGITGIQPPRIPFLNFQFTKKSHYYYTILVITLIVLFLFRRLVAYRTGRAFAAIRENEISAKAMGIYTTYYKVLAFTIAAMIAGVAGCTSSLHPFRLPRQLCLSGIDQHPGPHDRRWNGKHPGLPRGRAVPDDSAGILAGFERGEGTDLRSPFASYRYLYAKRALRFYFCFKAQI